MSAPKSFLPQQDTGQLGGFVRGDDGMSFQVMQPKIEVFRQAVLHDPAVESVAGFIGGGRGINNAQMLVRLKPLKERKVSAQKVIERIRRNAAEGARRAPVADRRPGHPLRRRLGGGSYQYTLRSDDLARPADVGAARARRAAGAAGADRHRGRAGVEPAGHAGRRSRGRAQLGVDMAMVTQVLNNAFSQRQVSTIYDRLNQYRVVMEVAPQYAQGPEALDQVHVITAAGQRVPLSAFSQLHTNVGRRPGQPQRAVRVREHRRSSWPQASA